MITPHFRTLVSFAIVSSFLSLPFDLIAQEQDQKNEQTDESTAKKKEPVKRPPPPKRPDVSIRIGPAGIGRVEPGSWGLAAIDVTNRKNTPLDYRNITWIADNPGLQFGREVWVPARSRRRTWVPIYVPPTDERRVSVNLKYSAFILEDGEEVYLKGSTDQNAEGQPLSVLGNPTCVWIIRDGTPTHNRIGRAVKHFVENTFKRQVSQLSLASTDFPVVPEALEIVDAAILMSDRIAESAAAVTATRRWIRNGGRLWIMADQVSSETIEALLGDQLQLTELDRVTLTDFNIDPDPRISARANSKVSLEQPVELIRTIAEGGNVTHRVGEWPAAIQVPMGAGQVICTTLAFEGWVLPNNWIEREIRQRGRSFEITPSASDLANIGLRAAPFKPIGTQNWKDYLTEQIGYTIPQRSSVMWSLLGYCVALIVAIAVMRRSGRVENLIWFVPLATIVVAVLLVGIGSAGNQLESSVHVGQFVEVEQGLDELAVSGVVGVYSDELIDHDTGSIRGGMMLPEKQSASTWRMMWSDFDKWQIKKLDYPAKSVRFAPFATDISVDKPISVKGTFDETGFRATIHRGILSELEDAVVVSQSRIALPLALENNNATTTATGAFGAELPQGEFLTGSLLSDEQQRRQKFWRQTLSHPERLMRYPNQLTLMAWTQPLDMGFNLPFTSENQVLDGSALVAIPITIERPAAGNRIALPAPFLTYKSVRAAGGMGFSSAYKGSLGTWISTSTKGVSTLRFQLPSALLPLKLDEATLEITITAPSRTVSISSGLNEKLQPIRSLKSPVGTVAIGITNLEALKLDPQGGLHVQIEVGDVEIDESKKGDFGTQDQNWRIDHVQLEAKATIE